MYQLSLTLLALMGCIVDATTQWGLADMMPVKYCSSIIIAKLQPNQYLDDKPMIHLHITSSNKTEPDCKFIKNMETDQPHNINYTEGLSFELTCTRVAGYISTSDTDVTLTWKLQQFDGDLLISKFHNTKDVFPVSHIINITNLDRNDHGLLAICSSDGQDNKNKISVKFQYIEMGTPDMDWSRNFTEVRNFPEGEPVPNNFSDPVVLYQTNVVRNNSDQLLFDPITLEDNGTILGTWTQKTMKSAVELEKKSILVLVSWSMKITSDLFPWPEIGGAVGVVLCIVVLIIIACKIMGRSCKQDQEEEGLYSEIQTDQVQYVQLDVRDNSATTGVSNNPVPPYAVIIGTLQSN